MKEKVLVRNEVNKMNKKMMLAVMVLSAVVNGVYASGTNNLVGGTDNVATANSAAVFGYQNVVNANNALAIGENNTVNGTNSFAGGNNSKAEGRNTFAFGSHAEALTEYTYAIGSQARTSAYDAIAIGNGAYAGGVSSVVIGRSNAVSGDNTTVIGANNQNVTAGQSLIMGYNNVTGSEQEQIVVGVNSKTSGQGATVIGTHGQATGYDTTAIGNNTIADKPNSVALGTNSVTDNAVNQLQAMVNNTTYVFAGTDATSVVSVGSKDRAGYGGVKHYVRQIQNVAAGRVDASSTDAVNGSQLNAAYDAINTMSEDMDAHNRILANHEQRIDVLEHQTHNALTNLKSDISRLDGRVNKVGAGAAALAGLYPMEFNKDDKFSASIAYGHYNNANAVALGLYYRPNEKVLLGIAGTFGSENMYSVSASFKFGKHSEYESQAKQGEIEAMKAQIAELTARLDAVSK